MHSFRSTLEFDSEKLDPQTIQLKFQEATHLPL